MKLYVLSQYVNNSYDVYLSCVVAADSEEDAITITPCHPTRVSDEWVNTEDIEVLHIGEAKEGTERGVIHASFNAG